MPSSRSSREGCTEAATPEGPHPLCSPAAGVSAPPGLGCLFLGAARRFLGLEERSR